MDTPDFEAKVNEIVGSMTKAEDGKWTLPEEVEPAMAYAAMAERRRRDTQSEYSKVQNRLKALETENAQLAQNWEKDLVEKLTLEQRADLEELKATDPDAWRQKLVELEQTGKTQFSERKAEISKQVTKESELERRQRVLEEFSAAHEDFQLTDEILENDIPPRFAKRLESGEWDFETFVEESYKFLTGDKAIKQPPKAPAGPNLTKQPGAAAPSQDAIDADIIQSYRNEVY